MSIEAAVVELDDDGSIRTVSPDVTSLIDAVAWSFCTTVEEVIVNVEEEPPRVEMVMDEGDTEVTVPSSPPWPK